jgi:hypothetical protein
MDCFRYILKLAKTLELKNAATFLCILLYRQISGMRKREHRMRIRLLSLQNDQLEMVLETEQEPCGILHCSITSRIIEIQALSVPCGALVAGPDDMMRFYA